jgi:hypothetical protein
MPIQAVDAARARCNSLMDLATVGVEALEPGVVPPGPLSLPTWARRIPSPSIETAAWAQSASSRALGSLPFRDRSPGNGAAPRALRGRGPARHLDHALQRRLRRRRHGRAFLACRVRSTRPAVGADPVPGRPHRLVTRPSGEPCRSRTWRCDSWSRRPSYVVCRAWMGCPSPRTT